MAQERLQPGQLFAGYKIERLLGVGGMGAVYLARHPNLPKLVALKLLTGVMTDDDDVRARFLREADHIARLDHPNIVAVYDRGDQDGQLWIAMQYIDGSDVAATLREGSLPAARAVRIITETAKALDFAHAADVLHRDVKPANIMLTRSTRGQPERILLADFGIAKALDDRSGITATGMFHGTLEYAAPEQLDASITLDARADQYSLGCTLYHLLTGSLPYPGHTPEQLMHGHLHLPAPRPSQYPRRTADRNTRGHGRGHPTRPRQGSHPPLPHLRRTGRRRARRPRLHGSGSDRRGAGRRTYGRSGKFPPNRARRSHTSKAPPHNGPTDTPPPATRSKRNRLIGLMVVLLIAGLVGGGVVLRNLLSSKTTGAELVLTGATDPGVNSFMPPAASPPPTNTQPAPTLQPYGNGTTVATQPLPGNRDGLYGGTLNNAECDRDKMITFLGSHPAQADAFVEALNTDNTLYWSGGHPLTAADIPTYLRELTPTVLRLDTRVTNHGFDGTHPTTLQSVFQAGTAVFVDAHGVPRARCYCGNPLTAPIALSSEPKPVNTPWPGYNPAALAAVQPSTATITNFVLVDVVTGQPFNRPAGTTGTNDTPHSQPVPPPQPTPTGSAPPAAPPGPLFRGTYKFDNGPWTGPVNSDCPGCDATMVTPGGSGVVRWNGTSYQGTLKVSCGSLAFTGTPTVVANGVVQELAVNIIATGCHEVTSRLMIRVGD